MHSKFSERPHSQKTTYLLLFQSFSTISQVCANKPCDLPFIMKNRKSVLICLCPAVLPKDRQAVVKGMFKGMHCKVQTTQLSSIYYSPMLAYIQRSYWIYFRCCKIQAWSTSLHKNTTIATQLEVPFLSCTCS